MSKDDPMDANIICTRCAAAYHPTHPLTDPITERGVECTWCRADWEPRYRVDFAPSYLATLQVDPDIAGAFIDKEGTFHENAESTLGALFDFCGCGCPESALRTLRDAMRLCEMRTKRNRESAKSDEKWYRDVYEKAERAVFQGIAGYEYLTWYLLDAKDMIEHGGSVAGSWLTTRGRMVLGDLERLELGGHQE